MRERMWEDEVGNIGRKRKKTRNRNINSKSPVYEKEINLC